MILGANSLEEERRIRCVLKTKTYCRDQENNVNILLSLCVLIINAYVAKV